MRARGYKPFGSNAEQDALLDRIIALAQPGTVAVLDLDGCLFDTRYRQAAIYREFGAQSGYPEFFHVTPESFINWDLKRPLRKAGMSMERLDAIYPEFEQFWRKCFFSDAYVQLDSAMPGAVDLVRACYERGQTIVYLTGRDHNMRAGTEHGLRLFGFPYDQDDIAEGRTLLITKPEFNMHDTTYKVAAMTQIQEMGKIVVLIDNEPANINAFHQDLPEALSVFIETDHSFRKDRPHSEIPRLRSFYRSTWFGAQEADFLP